MAMPTAFQQLDQRLAHLEREIQTLRQSLAAQVPDEPAQQLVKLQRVVRLIGRAGLVVAIGSSRPSPSSLNVNVWNTLSRCRSSTSAWAMAVWHSGHQIAGDFWR